MRANTLASFDAALEIGVDMVEFDLRGWRNELVLAHTTLHAGVCQRVRLQEALAYLSGPRFAGIELNVDVKQRRLEPALLSALHSAGLLDRTLISSQLPAVLDQVRALEPRARTGISVGGRVARAGGRRRDWRALALAGFVSRRWDALMAQHGLIDAGLLEDVVCRSGLLYAWTVNERSAIERLRTLGVHGITTADPRLFV